MPEFLRLHPPLEALGLLLGSFDSTPQVERTATRDALGRVTAEDVQAPYPLPSFDRSTVEGYAVRAADTHGANESLPAYLRLAGEVPMGGEPRFKLKPGECGLIHTGGMLPEGADGVVMVEQTQMAREGEIEIRKAAAVGENVIRMGEDVREGEVVIPAGSRLRPVEIGGLMALGITELRIANKPLVGLISSGDEVVPPEEAVSIGQVRDVNTYSLKALIEESGGATRSYGIVPDELKAMQKTVSQAHRECEMVVITAGSSASARDLTAEVIQSLGQPGVLAHGVNVRPGKPTILGVCEGKPVVGLPGNPVSALVIARLFVVPTIEKLLGVKVLRPRPIVKARLALNLSSQAGREDWVGVRLMEDNGEYRAEPIFGKSNLIFTLARADGLLRIPADANGLAADEEVDVWLM